MNDRESAWTHNRQFIVTGSDSWEPEGWQVDRLSSDWKVLRRNLPVTRASEHGTFVAVLGEVLDPERPTDTDQQVVDRLLGLLTAGPDGHERLEAATHTLGGRWVLITDDGREARVYPDAHATRSVVVAGPEFGGTGAASHAPLLSLVAARGAGLEANLGPTKLGTLTPVAGVNLVLPNHRAELRTGVARRIWPGAGKQVRLPEGAAARRMSDLLMGVVRAASLRWDLEVGLTAGYDSRLTAAAAVAAGVENMRFFTQARRKPVEADLSTAAEVAAALGVEHYVVDVKDVEGMPTLKEAMLANGGFVNLSRSAFGLNIGADEMLVQSHCIEAVRRNSSPAAFVGGIKKYELQELEGREDIAPAALVDLEHWLDGIPDDPAIAPTSLHDWERYHGVILAPKYAAIDVVARAMASMNCREFHAVGLLQPREVLGPPNRLLRRMFELLAPEMLEIPFNNRPLVI